MKPMTNFFPKLDYFVSLLKDRILKHRRDGMSRLASSRNVQWSAEGATNCVYSRVQNYVNLSCLRSGNFEETTKTINGIFFEKNEKMYFWQKPKGVILHHGMTEN